MLSVLKKVIVEPGRGVVPKLAEISPAFADLTAKAVALAEERQQAIVEAQALSRAGVTAKFARDAAAEQSTKAHDGRIAALLGYAEIAPATTLRQKEERLGFLMQRIADLDEAI